MCHIGCLRLLIERIKLKILSQIDFLHDASKLLFCLWINPLTKIASRKSINQQTFSYLCLFDHYEKLQYLGSLINNMGDLQSFKLLSKKEEKSRQF